MKAQMLALVAILVITCPGKKALAQAPAKDSKAFNGYAWLQGIKRSPSATINKREFSKQYNANKAWWDSAFSYLKKTDLTALKPGRYTLYGNDDVYVNVTDAAPKSKDEVLFEAHKSYADIHCVVSGEELIGVAPYASVVEKKAYDPVKDIAFYSTGKGKYYLSDAHTLFIMFPERDAHCGGIRVKAAETANIKKVVVKVRTTK